MNDLTLIFLHTVAAIAGYALIVLTGFGAYWIYRQAGAMEFFCVPLLLYVVWSKMAEDHLYMSWFPAYRSAEYMKEVRIVVLVLTGGLFIFAIAHRLHFML